MTIQAPDKMKLARGIMLNSLAAHEWINTVPPEINSAFFDNPYSEAMMDIIEDLMEAVFTPAEIEAIDWFNNTWVFDRDASVLFDGVDYLFDTPDEYFNFIVETEGFCQS